MTRVDLEEISASRMVKKYAVRNTFTWTKDSKYFFSVILGNAEWSNLDEAIIYNNYMDAVADEDYGGWAVPVWVTEGE